MLAAQQAPLTIQRVSIRHVGRIAKHLDRARQSSPVHAAVGNVAEDQPLLIRVPHRSLDKPEALGQRFQLGVADDIGETRIVRIHQRVPHYRGLITGVPETYQSVGATSSKTTQTPSLGSCATSLIASVTRRAISSLRCCE